jgi:hypothetical protein
MDLLLCLSVGPTIELRTTKIMLRILITSNCVMRCKDTPMDKALIG